MTKFKILALILLAITVSLSGCGIVKCKLCSQGFDDDSRGGAKGGIEHYSGGEMGSEGAVLITVTGYGAADTQISNKPQQELMALRASEVDAYRTLAERVMGVQLSGSTKVADFLTNYDHLRAVVDGYIRQAKIISQGITRAGYYETTLSLSLDQRFFNSFQTAQMKPMSSGIATGDRSEAYADHANGNNVAASTLSVTDTHYNLSGAGQYRME